MKKKIIVTYVLSLVCMSITSVAFDRAMLTADEVWVLVTSAASIMSLLFIMLTFSFWKSR